MDINKCDANGRMSRVVVAGDTIYLSGMVAPAQCRGITEQTKWILTEIEKTLHNQESSLKNMLSASIYLRDMKDFDSMNQVWDSLFGEALPPARTCVEAGLASPHALVEITVVAAK